MSEPLWRPYRRAIGVARPYWAQLAVLTALSLLSTPLSLLAPLPLAIAVDSVIGDRPVPGFLQPFVPGGADASSTTVLVFATALMVGIALLNQLRGLAKSVLKTYTGQRLVLDLRASLFAHAQRLSLRYHDRTGTSDATYRIHYDAAEVKNLALDGVTPFASASVTLVAMIVVVWRIDAQLAVVALVVAPLLFGALRLSASRLRGGWHGVKRLDSSIMAVVAETLGSLRVVKAFGQEQRQRDVYFGRAEEKLRARTRLALHEQGLGLVIGMVVACGTAAVLLIGTRHVVAGTLTVGQLYLVMSYLSKLYDPLARISDRIGEVQSTLVGAERAFALLDQPPDVAEHPAARPLRRAAGAVAFEHVCFSYDGGQSALDDVSFTVRPGDRIGIRGATGAGKTTMVSLLLRFYDPTGGRILLDGVDLRDYRLADLRDQFAVVLQEPVLFSVSIAENIAYARPGASRAAVAAAAQAAHVHDFVTALPDGYDTLVGERGMRLSGGERQRIALARAFLKDAPILVLDEPTSAVDDETEAAIMAATDELMAGRTSFLIAHRLSTLDVCDTVLRLELGRLSRPRAS